jgi:hypothetical protein
MRKECAFLGGFSTKSIRYYMGLLVFSFAFSFSLNAQFTQGSSPVFSSESNVPSTVGPSGGYQPFSPFTPSQQNPFGAQDQPFGPPVLYGPGGNPIGGLPVTDGVGLLFFAVLGYCIYKTVKRYKTTKI